MMTLKDFELFTEKIDLIKNIKGGQNDQPEPCDDVSICSTEKAWSQDKTHSAEDWSDGVVTERSDVIIV